MDGLDSTLDDAEVLLDLAAEEGDPSTFNEVVSELVATQAELATLEVESLYFGEYDDYTAILSVHAGAGGVTPRIGRRSWCACTPDTWPSGD